jgi:hypothetical protein
MEIELLSYIVTVERRCAAAFTGGGDTAQAAISHGVHCLRGGVVTPEEERRLYAVVGEN